jgi:hypothetical protein
MSLFLPEFIRVNLQEQHVPRVPPEHYGAPPVYEVEVGAADSAKTARARVAEELHVATADFAAIGGR